MFYNTETQSWSHTSLAIPYIEFNRDERDLDLTLMPSNGIWDCIVTPDPSPTPLYDDVICSRVIPDESDYETQTIRYMPQLVMDIYGYRYDGVAESEWAFGGQITLD